MLTNVAVKECVNISTGKNIVYFADNKSALVILSKNKTKLQYYTCMVS